MRGLSQAQVLACMQAGMPRTGPVPSARASAAHLGDTVRAAYPHIQALTCRVRLRVALKACGAVGGMQMYRQ